MAPQFVDVFFFCGLVSLLASLLLRNSASVMLLFIPIYLTVMLLMNLIRSNYIKNVPPTVYF